MPVAHALSASELASLASAVQRAVHAALKNPSACADVLIHANALASAHNVRLPKLSRSAPVSATQARTLLLDAGYAFRTRPTAHTLRALYAAVHAMGNHVAALDAHPLRPITACRAPEPPAPIVRYACPDSLRWQSSPLIGTDPATVAAAMSHKPDSKAAARIAGAVNAYALAPTPLDPVTACLRERFAAPLILSGPAKPERKPTGKRGARVKRGAALLAAAIQSAACKPVAAPVSAETERVASELSTAEFLAAALQRTADMRAARWERWYAGKAGK